MSRAPAPRSAARVRWWRAGGLSLVGAIAILLAGWAQSAAAATTPTTPATVVIQAAPGGSDQAWITVIGVVAAAVLSATAATFSATAAARYGLRQALAQGDSQVKAALKSGEAQVKAALAAAAAQQETIRAQLEQQAGSLRAARLEHLADHRRRRAEETILALQDALARLATTVEGFARERATVFNNSGKWVPPPMWAEPLDHAFAEAYKLLQRLPRGSQEDPDDETWKAVRHAVDPLYQAVLYAPSALDQATMLKRFEAGIKLAQDSLGDELDRLDQQLLNELRPRGAPGPGAPWRPGL